MVWQHGSPFVAADNDLTRISRFPVGREKTESLLGMLKGLHVKEVGMDN